MGLPGLRLGRRRGGDPACHEGLRAEGDPRRRGGSLAAFQTCRVTRKAEDPSGVLLGGSSEEGHGRDRKSTEGDAAEKGPTTAAECPGMNLESAQSQARMLRIHLSEAPTGPHSEAQAEAAWGRRLLSERMVPLGPGTGGTSLGGRLVHRWLRVRRRTAW